MKTYRYVPISADQIPSGVTWNVPRRHRGQMIEVAYGGWGRAAQHDEGDEYKRETDLSLHPQATSCYRRAEVPTAHGVRVAPWEDER